MGARRANRREAGDAIKVLVDETSVNRFDAVELRHIQWIKHGRMVPKRLVG